jgi:enterochelin esterase family protein
MAVYRGINAPPAPARSEPLKGTLVSRDFSSANLHEHRSVWIYEPPCIPTGAHLPVIYMADGGAKGFAPIAEALILEKRIRPVILVGIEAAAPLRPQCYSANCDRRAKEYELGRDGANVPFQNHMHFLVEEVMPYIAAHYPVSQDRRDRTVAGVSQGSVWAAQTAQIKPDLFGAAIALSGTSAVEMTPKALAHSRVFTGAGEFEADRLAAMRHFAETARAAGAEVQVQTLWAGHSYLAWNIMLAEALRWLYPPRKVAPGSAIGLLAPPSQSLPSFIATPRSRHQNPRPNAMRSVVAIA